MAPGTRRANRGNYVAEQDDFDGLPTRKWREDWVPVAPPPAVEVAPRNDIWSIELPYGMPKDYALLPPHSQELLRAMRSGAYHKRPHPDDEEGEGEIGPDKQDKKGDEEPGSRGFTVKVWRQVPRNAEEANVSHLAKRRKGTVTLPSKLAVGPASGPSVTRATVRRIDAAGNPYTQEVTLTEGQPVEGEIISTSIVVVPQVPTEMRSPSTPNRRKPPPPKRKGRPGRGRRKKLSLSGRVTRAAEALPLVVENGAVAIPGGQETPVVAAALEKPEPAPSQSDTVDQDDDEGDDDDDEGDEEGEEGELEEGDTQMSTPDAADGDSVMTDSSPVATKNSVTPGESGPDAEPPQRIVPPAQPLNLAPPLVPSRFEGSPLKNVVLPSPTEPSPHVSPVASVDLELPPPFAVRPDADAAMPDAPETENTEEEEEEEEEAGTQEEPVSAAEGRAGSVPLALFSPTQPMELDDVVEPPEEPSPEAIIPRLDDVEIVPSREAPVQEESLPPDTAPEPTAESADSVPAQDLEEMLVDTLAETQTAAAAIRDAGWAETEFQEEMSVNASPVEVADECHETVAEAADAAADTAEPIVDEPADLPMETTGDVEPEPPQVMETAVMAENAAESAQLQPGAQPEPDVEMQAAESEMETIPGLESLAAGKPEDAPAGSPREPESEPSDARQTEPEPTQVVEPVGDDDRVEAANPDIPAAPPLEAADPPGQQQPDGAAESVVPEPPDLRTGDAAPPTDITDAALPATPPADDVGGRVGTGKGPSAPASVVSEVQDIFGGLETELPEQEQPVAESAAATASAVATKDSDSPPAEARPLADAAVASPDMQVAMEMELEAQETTTRDEDRDRVAIVPEDRPETEPEDRPEKEPEDRPETQPEDRSETQPEDRPESQPEDLPETEPGDQPETEPEDRPETEPEDRPEMEPEHGGAETPAAETAETDKEEGNEEPATEAAGGSGPRGMDEPAKAVEVEKEEASEEGPE